MINKIGKIGKLNAYANKKIKKMFIEKGITYCEKCGSDFGLSFAHFHKRIWYRSQPEKLWDFNQVLLLCLRCHEKIEYDKELTKKIFIDLRGKEFDLV